MLTLTLKPPCGHCFAMGLLCVCQWRFVGHLKVHRYLLLFFLLSLVCYCLKYVHHWFVFCLSLLHHWLFIVCLLVNHCLFIGQSLFVHWSIVVCSIFISPSLNCHFHWFVIVSYWTIICLTVLLSVDHLFVIVSYWTIICLPLFLIGSSFVCLCFLLYHHWFVIVSLWFHHWFVLFFKQTLFFVLSVCHRYLRLVIISSSYWSILVRSWVHHWLEILSLGKKVYCPVAHWW